MRTTITHIFLHSKSQVCIRTLTSFCKAIFETRFCSCKNENRVPRVKKKFERKMEFCFSSGPTGVARNFKREGGHNFKSHQKNLAYFSHLATFVPFLLSGRVKREAMAQSGPRRACEGPRAGHHCGPPFVSPKKGHHVRRCPIFHSKSS